MAKKIIDFEVQYLRGLAALAVFIHHYTEVWLQNETYLESVTQFTSYGTYGVDLFFVISGFIVAYICYDLPKDDAIKNFLIARFFRIFPPVWLISILAIISYLITGVSTFPSFEILFNQLTLLPGPDVLGVTWTLSHELTFYLSFAIVFFLIVKNKNNALLLMVSVYLFFGCISFFAEQTRDTWPGIFISVHNFEFMLGITAFMIEKFENVKKIIINVVVLTVLTVLILVLTVFPTDILHYEKERLLAGLFSFLFFINRKFLFSGLVKNKNGNKLSIDNLLFKLGNISFSLYLVHYIVIRFFMSVSTKIGSNEYFIIFMLSSIPATIIVSYFIYAYVENPSINFGKRFRTK